MTYLPPGTPDPGPGWVGTPHMGWANTEQEAVDGYAQWQQQQAPPPAGAAPAASGGLRDRVLAEFPFMAAFLDVPELAALIERGVKELWSPQTFQAQVQGTAWWRDTNQRQQTWLTKSPAQREAEIEEAASYAVAQWQQIYGSAWLAKHPEFADPKGGEARRYGEMMASGQWTRQYFDVLTRTHAIADPEADEYVREQQRREELARARKRPEEIAEELWQQARGDYFVRISKEAAKEWATGIMNGTRSYAEYADYLRQTASQQFPFFKDSIENGVKPGVLFDPYLSIAAEEYGTSREAVIANDKLWGQLMVHASAKGTKTEMPSTADWLSYVRAQPEFERSMKGQKFGLSLAASFGRAMGEAV